MGNDIGAMIAADERKLQAQAEQQGREYRRTTGQGIP